MRALLLASVVLTGLALVPVASADETARHRAPAQCFVRSEVSGFARHDAHTAYVRVDNNRVFPVTATGDCKLLSDPQSGPKGQIGRAELISRARAWFCPGDTADLQPWNMSGAGRCAVTIGHEVR